MPIAKVLMISVTLAGLPSPIGEDVVTRPIFGERWLDASKGDQLDRSANLRAIALARVIPARAAQARAAVEPPHADVCARHHLRRQDYRIGGHLYWRCVPR